MSLETLIAEMNTSGRANVGPVVSSNDAKKVRDKAKALGLGSKGEDTTSSLDPKPEITEETASKEDKSSSELKK